MSKTKGTEGETDSLKLDKESRLTQEEFSRVAKEGDDLLTGQGYWNLATVAGRSAYAGTQESELLSTNLHFLKKRNSSTCQAHRGGATNLSDHCYLIFMAWSNKK